MYPRVGRCFFLISATREEWDCLLKLVRLIADGYPSRKGVREEGEYVAVISTYQKQKFSINRWLICDNQSSSSPCTPITSKSRVSRLTWTALQDNLHSMDDVQIDQLVIANEIHNLLDHIPWDIEDYMLMDVVLVVPKSLSPSFELYGALWRLKKWLNGSIYFLTEHSTGCDWIEWSRFLSANMETLESISQTLSEPIIWRGALYVQECRTQTSLTQNIITFPDFKLTLHTNDMLSEELCINSAHHPTHLEIVQLVDMSQISLLWISSVHLQLYPINVTITTQLFIGAVSNITDMMSLFNSKHSFILSFTSVILRSVSSVNYSSVAAFNEIFQQSHDTGVLLRLCGRSPVREHNLSHKTTQDWKMYVLEQESITNSPMHSSTYTSVGPLLLIPPHSTTFNKCHAWLLQRPQSLDTVGEMLQYVQAHTITTANVSHGLLVDQFKIFNNPKTICYSHEEFLNNSQLPTSSHSTYNISITCPELTVLGLMEEHFKKKIKRTNTSDLTLGGVTAPPPGCSSSVPFASDILSCFTDSGEPVASLELLPFAMEDTDGLSLHMIEPENASSVSYKKIVSNTPTRARKYHGISYCLSEDDKTKDTKLTKVQQRYIPRERSCNCSNYQTPRQWRKHRLFSYTEGTSVLPNTDNTSAVLNNESENDLVPNSENGPNNDNEVTTRVSIRSVSGSCSNRLDDYDGNDTVNNPEVPQQFDDPCSPRSTENSTCEKHCTSSRKLLNTSSIAANSMTGAGNFTVVSNASNIKSVSEEIKWTTKATKKYLEECIVSTLKAHGMKRSHTLFHKCYLKLFKISKMFVKELNTTADLGKQIKKIVENTVKQVVEFELDQAHMSL